MVGFGFSRSVSSKSLPTGEAETSISHSLSLSLSVCTREVGGREKANLQKFGRRGRKRGSGENLLCSLFSIVRVGARDISPAAIYYVTGIPCLGNYFCRETAKAVFFAGRQYISDDIYEKKMIIAETLKALGD